MDVGRSEQFEDVPLAGLPEGVRARVRRQLRTDAAGRSVEVRDRRGRTKLASVWLYTASIDERREPSATELTFLLGAERRAWRTIVEALGRGDGDRAWTRTCELVRGGVVELECRVDGVHLGAPRRWRLTARWDQRRRRQATRRGNERRQWEDRAQAAEAIRHRYPQLAHALRRHAGPVERRVLVHAAEDLLAHRSHHGPRAFSQQHFGTTKARDDVERILARRGVEIDALVELGIRRAGRSGVAGPVELRSATGRLDFTGIRGPTDFRLDQPGLALSTTAEVLIVIENRQAAETVSDRYPDHAVFWTQGMMGPESLAVLEQLARQVTRTLAVPDADLGGVRIAEQILRVAPAAEVVDVGSVPHERRQPFVRDSVSEVGLKAALVGPAGVFARACLERGYGVEQELPALDAVSASLARGSAPGELAEQTGARECVEGGLPAGLESRNDRAEA
jgi:hypothetical protein